MRFAAKNMSLPFAILSANDLMAFGAMDTLKYELGYTIGKDVALIGFDNMFMSEWPTYSLTTFSQPISLMVQDGVTLLLNNITNKNMTPVRKRYPLQLIERNSTRV
jgi:DNA-binding LacI/PurR family transcriptional regulator